MVVPHRKAHTLCIVVLTKAAPLLAVSRLSLDCAEFVNPFLSIAVLFSLFLSSLPPLCSQNKSWKIQCCLLTATKGF